MIGDFDDIFGRLKAKLPSRWFGGWADALPVFDGVLAGIASLLSFAYSLYAYARLQTRIMSATDGWLDMIAADFFGPDQVRRKTGQSDTSYRLVILANLFREKATRGAIVSILTSLTGRAPTIIEPTRPADTGAYGNNRRATLVGASIFRQDWQGHQLLSALPRTNFLWPSHGPARRSINGAVNSTVTEGITDPRGGTQASQIVAVGANTGFGPFWPGSAQGLVSGQTYVFKIAMRGLSGGEQVRFFLETSATNLVTLTTSWQVFTVSGLYTGTGALVAYLQSTVVAGGGFQWCDVNALNIDGLPIITESAPVTVVDYTLPGNGVVALGQTPASGAVLSVISPQDGITTEQAFGNGDGQTSVFTVNVPTGPYAPIGYGAAGAYGSTVLPYQAFVIAYRPSSNAGIASVAGYGTSPGGYSTPSWAEYASMSMVTGGVTDDDIFAAIDAVKPAGTIVWTRISN